MNIMQQTACLVVNPIMVYNYGFLFNCMMVGQALDSMMAILIVCDGSVFGTCLFYIT